MSYTPTNWKAGDVVTSAKLNKIEQGITSGANVLIAHATQEVIEDSSGQANITEVLVKLDKTAREILDADFTIVINNSTNDSAGETITTRNFLVVANTESDPETGYFFKIISLYGADATEFYAKTEEDYPEATISAPTFEDNQ